MKVLITNLQLRERTGTELYVRDLALGLQSLDHVPIVYSPLLGELGEELRRGGIAVTDDLRTVAEPPDLIHGHHAVETMTALLHFPGVPAVWVCHDATAWHDTAPLSPRILQYVAVDEAVRDRLRFRHGIPDGRIRIIGNAVDLQRFRPRPPLPERPNRALIFSNYASAETHVTAVQEACRQAGLSLDIVGAGSTGAATAPEDLLGQYDLVFAKARCALEAMAVGAAVVLCDAGGLGPMVTAAEVRHLRRLNFGRRTLRDPLEPNLVLQEIRRYHAGDAAAVSQVIRATAGLDITLAALVELYEEVLAEARERTWDPAEEGRAAAAQLRWLSGLLRERAEMSQRLEQIRRDDRRSRLFRILARLRRQWGD